jgi:Domain of unknown function (DUF4878)
MHRYAEVMAVVLLVACGTGGAAAQTDKTPPASSTPEEVVTRYLDALKAGNFAAAYDQISKEMAQHKDRDAWAKEQQWTMQMSDAKIFSYKIFPGKIEGNLARVPNVLSSQDKFLNQLGVGEHELYTLVKEDGRWKIDRQVLLDKADQAQWFPPDAREK